MKICHWIFRFFWIFVWISHPNQTPPSCCKIQLKLSHQDFIQVRLPKFREKRYDRKEVSFGRSKSFWRFLRSPNGCSVEMRSIWHRNSGWKPPLRLARFNSVGGSPFSGSTFYELNLSARLSAVCKIQSLCGPPLAVRARDVDRLKGSESFGRTEAVLAPFVGRFGRKGVLEAVDRPRKRRALRSGG